MPCHKFLKYVDYTFLVKNTYVIRKCQCRTWRVLIVCIISFSYARVEHIRCLTFLFGIVSFVNFNFKGSNRVCLFFLCNIPQWSISFMLFSSAPVAEILNMWNIFANFGRNFRFLRSRRVLCTWKHFFSFLKNYNLYLKNEESSCQFPLCFMHLVIVIDSGTRKWHFEYPKSLWG